MTVSATAATNSDSAGRTSGHQPSAEAARIAIGAIGEDRQRPQAAGRADGRCQGRRDADHPVILQDGRNVYKSGIAVSLNPRRRAPSARARADSRPWCAAAAAARRRGRNPSSAITATRQSSHILMTSSRRAEPLNIQCLPSSLAETRSMVLLTPNGLLQRMQANGSSSLSTRAAAVAARKSICGLERDDLLRAGRLAQPALHAGVLGEAQHRPFGVRRQRAGRAGRHAGEAQRAALDIELDRAERRAFGQRHDVERRGRRAMQFAKRQPQHVALAADRREARRAAARDRAAPWRAAFRRACPDRRSRWWRRDRRRSRARAGSARPARWSCAIPSMSWRGLARSRKRNALAP